MCVPKYAFQSLNMLSYANGKFPLVAQVKPLAISDDSDVDMAAIEKPRDERWVEPNELVTLEDAMNTSGMRDVAPNLVTALQDFFNGESGDVFINMLYVFHIWMVHNIACCCCSFSKHGSVLHGVGKG